MPDLPITAQGGISTQEPPGCKKDPGRGAKPSLPKIPTLAPASLHPSLPADTASPASSPSPGPGTATGPRGAAGNGAALNAPGGGSLACTQGQAVSEMAEWGEKWASQQEVLRKHGRLQDGRAAATVVPSIPSPPAGSTPSSPCQPPPPTYLVLAVGTQKVSLSQPGDDGLGVPKRHAGQGDAAAFLRLYVLRRRLGERGGSCGAGGDRRDPPSFHLWPL